MAILAQMLSRQHCVETGWKKDEEGVGAEKPLVELSEENGI